MDESSVTRLIAELRYQPQLIAANLAAWMTAKSLSCTELMDWLSCNAQTLSRLAELKRPEPGPDYEGDVEIIAVSLRLSLTRLHAILDGTTPLELARGEAI